VRFMGWCRSFWSSWLGHRRCDRRLAAVRARPGRGREGESGRREMIDGAAMSVRAGERARARAGGPCCWAALSGRERARARVSEPVSA
jgi:hypothetical protein